MSGPEDFLSRWSRRKREAAEEAEDAEVAKARAGAAESETAGAQPKPPAAPAQLVQPAEPLFDLKDLPPIESITAATDIRPFLAPGVPPDLARAALRRAWTADPQIRDFVGLADYDWDYHTPGSMAGFGPLEMTDELRQAVARIVGQVSAEVGPGAPLTPSRDVNSAEKPNDIKTGEITSPTPHADSIVGPGQDVPVNRQEVAVSPPPPALSGTGDTAVQHQHSVREIMPSTVRRGHGRALPK